jgi:outer membrane protein TolC
MPRRATLRWLHQVMTRNNDLARTVLRVYRAQLYAARTGILAAPDLNVRLNSGAERKLSGLSSWQDKSGASLGIRYEVDLWGKLARAQDAAEWLSQASARFHAGKISPLDVANAEQNVLKQKDRLLELQHQRQQTLNEQTVLLAAPPGITVVEPVRLPQQPLPQINSGIPVSILSRRPDVNAEEMCLRAALSEIDAEQTQYYPSFALTGTLGTSSSAILTFLSNPVAGIGVSLTRPFLEWRK